eukprot:4165807-Pleurochrysis_carterae.AAC.1
MDVLNEDWLLGGDDGDEEAASRRAGVLTAAGALAPTDDGHIPTAAAAGVLAGAGGAQPEAELVARALSAAAQ